MLFMIFENPFLCGKDLGLDGRQHEAGTNTKFGMTHVLYHIVPKFLLPNQPPAQTLDGFFGKSMGSRAREASVAAAQSGKAYCNSSSDL